jgi:LPS O-antigen subunit length determinant protein (WzzB/FepE family)
MIEQEYIDRIYARLTEMDVVLDADPIEFGPSRLNYKVSIVRGHLSSTEKIFMEVSHNLQKIKRELLIKQTEYTLEQNQLIANDPHVRQGRSQKEREVLADTRLVHIQTKINVFTLSAHDLNDLMTVIKAKRTDLKDLQGRLRDQLKLCQEQISLGQRWGSKTFTAKTFDDPNVISTEVNTASLVDQFMTQRQNAEAKLDVEAGQLLQSISVEDELEVALSQTPKDTSPLEGSNSRMDDEILNNFVKTPLQDIDTNVDEIDLEDLFAEFGG